MFVTLTICGCVGLQMKKGFVLCGLRLFLWVIHIRHSFVVNGAAESAEQLQRGKFHCIFMLHLLCAAQEKTWLDNLKLQDKRPALIKASPYLSFSYTFCHCFTSFSKDLDISRKKINQK